MENKNNFLIYILCRDRDTKEILKKGKEIINLPEIQYVSDMNYFEFLNTIISECPHDFALACHDDVVLPINIEKRIRDTISRADHEFGQLNWGIIGNSGIEFFSTKIMRYLRNQNCSIIPPSSQIPRVATYIDGNTLLINIKNIRDRQISLPANFKGYNLYNLIFVIECYKKGLVSAIDSNLYVIHKSHGNQDSFNKAIENKTFLEYWQKDFLNHQITTINGIKNINPDLDYLIMQDIKTGENKKEKPKTDFYELVYNTIKNIYHQKERKKIIIICRTRLDRINKMIRCLDFIKIANLKYSKNIEIEIILSINNFESKKLIKLREIIINQYSDLNITYLISEEIPKNKFPRVFALEQAVNFIPAEENSYAWIIDDDDFIIPEAFQIIPFVLNENYLLTGNSIVFEEKWTIDSEISYPIFSKKIKTFDAFLIHRNITGDNYVPVCSVIYPIKILKRIFNEFMFEGNYLEDYFLILIAQHLLDTFHIPVNIAGISYHGSNTVLETDKTIWDYSYSTFISEIVNSEIIRSWIYDIVYSKEEERLKREIQSQKIELQEREIEIQSHKIESQAIEIEIQSHKIESQEREIEIKNNEIENIKNSKLWKLGEIYNNIKTLIR